MTMMIAVAATTTTTTTTTTTITPTMMMTTTTTTTTVMARKRTTFNDSRVTPAEAHQTISVDGGTLAYLPAIDTGMTIPHMASR